MPPKFNLKVQHKALPRAQLRIFRSLDTPIAASAVLAFAVACASHEVIGHGAACLATGGLVARLSSVYFHCSGGGVIADLGGPTANALVGLACKWLLHSQPLQPAARTTIVLVLAFNLLWLAGCLIWSALVGQGDFALAARQFAQSEFAARGLFCAVGIAVALLCLRWTALPRPVVHTAYVAAGVASCASALLYVGPVAPALCESALESFGAMAWLLLAPRFVAPTGKPAAVADKAAGRRLFPLAALAMLGLLVLGRGYERAPVPVIERTNAGKPVSAAHVER